MVRCFIVDNPEWVLVGENDDEDQFVVIPSGTALEVVDRPGSDPDWVEVIVPLTQQDPLTTEFPRVAGRLSRERPTDVPLTWMSHAEAVAHMREIGVSDLRGLEEMDPNGAGTLDDDEDWDDGDWYELEYRQLPDRLRPYVDAVIADPRFDSMQGSAGRTFNAEDVLAQHTDDLDSDERELVGQAALMVWAGTVGERLEARARELAQAVVGQPWYDPTSRQLQRDIEMRLGISDPHLVIRVMTEASQLSARQDGRGRRR